MMNIEYINTHLCQYDKRNPYYYPEQDDDGLPILPRKSGCYCYNCTYGLDKLAVHVLEFLKELSQFQGDEE